MSRNGSSVIDPRLLGLSSQRQTNSRARNRRSRSRSSASISTSPHRSLAVQPPQPQTPTTPPTTSNPRASTSSQFQTPEPQRIQPPEPHFQTPPNQIIDVLRSPSQQEQAQHQHQHLQLPTAQGSRQVYSDPNPRLQSTSQALILARSQPRLQTQTQIQTHVQDQDQGQEQQRSEGRISLWTPHARSSSASSRSSNIRFIRPLPFIGDACPFSLPVPLNRTTAELESLITQRKTHMGSAFSQILSLMYAVSTTQNLTIAQHLFRQFDYLKCSLKHVVEHIKSYIGDFGIDVEIIMQQQMRNHQQQFQPQQGQEQQQRRQSQSQAQVQAEQQFEQESGSAEQSQSQRQTQLLRAVFPATALIMFQFALTYCFIPADLQTQMQTQTQTQLVPEINTDTACTSSPAGGGGGGGDRQGPPSAGVNLAGIKKCAELMAANEVVSMLARLKKLMILDLVDERRHKGMSVPIGLRDAYTLILRDRLPGAVGGSSSDSSGDAGLNNGIVTAADSGDHNGNRTSPAPVAEGGRDATAVNGAETRGMDRDGRGRSTGATTRRSSSVSQAVNGEVTALTNEEGVNGHTSGDEGQ